jgi:hypothetical protein
MSANKPYMPTEDDGKSSWLQNFKTKLLLYASALGLTTAQTNQVNDDYTNYSAILAYVAAIKAYYKTVVKYKNEIRSGKTNSTVLAPLAAPPVLPTFSTTPILGDVFGREALLVKSIKANPAYTANTHIGSDLKIIGTDPHTTPAGGSTLPTERTAALKPVLKISLNKGGRPWIRWKKGHSNSLYIMVDRGTGVFALLTVATHHSYVDKFALPAAGATALWKYKAIYQDKNEDEEGAWSEVATCTVTGV